MGKIIGIVSGKGGVGKTTIAANLAYAITEFGEKVVLVDLDLVMANLKDLIDFGNTPITLHNFLRDEVDLHEIIYIKEKTKDKKPLLYFIPSSEEFTDYSKFNLKKIVKEFQQLYAYADYIILDLPAGMEKMTVVGIATCTDILIVLTPDIYSVKDAEKIIKTTNKLGVNILGAIINKRRGWVSELTKEEIEQHLNLPVLAEIPYEDEIRYSVLRKKIYIKDYKNNKGAQEFLRLAAFLTNKEYKIEEKKKKKRGIFSIFRRKR